MLVVTGASVPASCTRARIPPQPRRAAEDDHRHGADADLREGRRLPLRLHQPVGGLACGTGARHAAGTDRRGVHGPDAIEHSRAVDRQILTRGTTYEAEETLGIDGARRTFQTVKFPLLDEDGRATAVCGISTDITSQKEALSLRDDLAAAQQDAIDELRLSQHETVERLTKAIELHDFSTGGHVDRMAEIAALLGTHLGLDTRQVHQLRLAAPKA
jgi:hypothetical protein